VNLHLFLRGHIAALGDHNLVAAAAEAVELELAIGAGETRGDNLAGEALQVHANHLDTGFVACQAHRAPQGEGGRHRVAGRAALLRLGRRHGKEGHGGDHHIASKQAKENFRDARAADHHPPPAAEDMTRAGSVNRRSIHPPAGKVALTFRSAVLDSAV
jgi:hypothetical protein